MLKKLLKHKMFFTDMYKKAGNYLGFFCCKLAGCVLYAIFSLVILSIIKPTMVFAEITQTKPNIVLIISDDQSWEHTSKAGYPYIKTPNFDRIANEGIYFDRTYATAPSCAPSRAGILSGLYSWQTESAAILDAIWPDDLQSFPMLLRKAGYKIGYTGKGSHVRRPDHSMRLPRILGEQFNQIKRIPADKNLTHWDLAKNLDAFLNQRSNDEPFMFWVGSLEPHRPYADAVSSYFDKVKEQPDFLPMGYPTNFTNLKDDFSRYLEEIEIFDQDVGKIIGVLDKRGLLDNTIIVVTADNGMPFPKAKIQNYEYGVRVPLAIRWGNGIHKPHRTVTSMISLIDLAPTFLELAGIKIPKEMGGKSLVPIFLTKDEGDVDKSRQYVFSAFERHTDYRSSKEPTYPRRVIHTERFALIRNYFPDRWPSGGPPVFGETYKSLLSDYEHGNDLSARWKSFVFDKRPYEELYDLKNDPFQFNNIIDDPEYVDVKESLQKILDDELTKTGDPVHLTGKDYFAQFVHETSSTLDDIIAKEKEEKQISVLRKIIPYLLRPKD